MNNNVEVSRFSSLEHLLKSIGDCPSDRIRFNDWSGASSYDHALSIVRQGVDLGRAKEEVHKLEHSRQEMVQTMDVCGSVVNMDAYLSGEPENMFDLPLKEQPTKFLTLAIDVGEHARTDASEMVNKAVAIASMVDSLENSGYRVSVEVMFVSLFDVGFDGAIGRSTLIAMTKIKEHHQPLSIGQLTGCFHPSFLRVLMFSHTHRVFQKYGSTPPNDMGRVVGTRLQLDRVLEAVNEPEMQYIPNSILARTLSLGRVGSLSSVESAVKMVNYFIRKKDD